MYDPKKIWFHIPAISNIERNKKKFMFCFTGAASTTLIPGMIRKTPSV